MDVEHDRPSPFKKITRNGSENSESHRRAQRALESAAYVTRGGRNSDPVHDERSSQRTERVRRETQNLANWAAENGFLTTRYPRPLISPQGRGGEHIVSQDPITGRFLKATRPERFFGFGIALGDYCRGATPAEYLDRMFLHNVLFSDDIHLEGVVRIDGKISVIISQPTIKGRAATLEEIDEYMSHQRTERFAAGIYYKAEQGVLLYDLHPRNVLVDSNDIAHVIDPVIQRVRPDFADFIRHQPHLVDNSF